MRPASSTSTLMPATASWYAAMPPAAPLPTTIASQGPEPGVMDAARRRDSSRIAARSRSSVGSAGMSGLRLPPAVRAILAVDGQAADERGQDLVALVPEILVDADLRRVVAVDRGLLGVEEERLEGSPLRRMLTDVAEERVDLRRLRLGLLVARDVERGIRDGLRLRELVLAD